MLADLSPTALLARRAYTTVLASFDQQSLVKISSVDVFSTSFEHRHLDLDLSDEVLFLRIFPSLGPLLCVRSRLRHDQLVLFILT